MGIETLGGKFPHTPRASEKASFIFMFIKFDNICPLERRFQKDHREISRSGIDANFWNWNDKLSSPLSNIADLIHDFVFKIPWQDQHIIRLCFSDHFRRENRDVRTGEKLALLIRIAINGIVNKIAAYAAIVQQRIAFPRRPVPNDRFPLPFDFNQEFEQLSLCLSYLLSKCSVGVEAFNARSFFSLHKLAVSFRQVMGLILCMMTIDTERSPVRWEFFHIKQSQPVCRKDSFRAHQREVEEMLVINSVKLVFLHQFHQMRELNCDNSLRSQQQLDPCHKVIDVGNLSKDIVPEYK